MRNCVYSKVKIDVGVVGEFCWVREEFGQNPTFHAPLGDTEATVGRLINSRTSGFRKGRGEKQEEKRGVQDFSGCAREEKHSIETH
ncbi:hypothetical protein DEO72_LG2g2664 [Vigna unguiculata]|uniref:Uncharacterized protein n=1 Tax=Vigna unguiculata TaxID=3917 RepID=A0A4D6L1G1_VIGUN|nr:hypothetical protein DEO72_LG2g2664 [Vigna unguiculata]